MKHSNGVRERGGTEGRGSGAGTRDRSEPCRERAEPSPAQQTAEWESEDGGYIDVVARDEDVIVFCDVQARKGAEAGATAARGSVGKR